MVSGYHRAHSLVVPVLSVFVLSVFVYMISFFRELLLHAEVNRLTPAKIAVVCCNCMVKTDPDEAEEREMQGKHSLQLVISHFLTTAMI
jgi:hypothetical protein